MAPVDPYDPFKGKYIVLNFKDNRIPATDSAISFSEEVFITFKEDKEGFARPAAVSNTKPAQTDYLKTFVNKFSFDSAVTINYPFNKYYMEEFKASSAESIYRERNLDSSNRTYALVSIFKGDAVIKDVLINDSSIAEIIHTSITH
jgi:uncharacterized membrane-anchored protein